jgi:hypothetical protein
MLTIMFLIKNMATLHILGMAQFLSFLFRHNTIRLGLAFHVGNMLLATFQSLILFLRQRATSCPLLSAVWAKAASGNMMQSAAKVLVACMVFSVWRFVSMPPLKSKKR